MNWSGEEPLYVLKLEMLLFILRTHQQTCELRAMIPADMLPLSMSRSSREKISHPCKAMLIVVQGQVQLCIIRDTQDAQMLFEGKQALARLEHCKELSWVVQPMHTDFAQLPFHRNHHDRGEAVRALQQADQEQWFLRPPPRLVKTLEKREIDDLPHKHRQVLLLVNGQRGISDLCRVLACSPEQLTTIFHDLETRGLITVADPQTDRSTR